MGSGTFVPVSCFYECPCAFFLPAYHRHTLFPYAWEPEMLPGETWCRLDPAPASWGSCEVCLTGTGPGPAATPQIVCRDHGPGSDGLPRPGRPFPGRAIITQGGYAPVRMSRRSGQAPVATGFSADPVTAFRYQYLKEHATAVQPAFLN